MSVKSDIRKFKTYKEQVQFTRGITSTIIKVLLIGSDQFKQDVLGDTKEIKLKKNESYEVCVCEEDHIKELNKYTKKIKDGIFVVSNEEQSELTLQYKYPSMDNKYNADIEDNIDNSLRNNDYVNQIESKQETEENCNSCDDCKIQKEFEESINAFVCEYVEVIYSKFKGIDKEELYKILYEMFADSYNAGRLASQNELYGLLGNYIEEERNMNDYNDGNGYVN